MSLITRCQACSSAFRVQRAQLAARGGKVRCGKCGAIFDGIAGLVEEGAELLRLEPSPQLGLFDPSRRPLQSAAPRTSAPQENGQDEAELPEFLAKARPQRRSPWLWGTLAAVAAVVLVAQTVHRFRTEISVLVPQARPALLAACRFANCDLPLPRRPELMAIESSDLQADPDAESVIVLNAVLRNRAAFAQAYPALELTLTDESDRPVVRKVLMPDDYLEPARAAEAAQGLPAGAEAAFRVNLDSGRTRATGYRLYLFFPR
jgi:predicted Zn finger-like uncharacterized protein